MKPDVQAYIAKIKPLAQKIEIEFGIPWTFAMVQAAHESRYGESRLTVEANNLFGITGDSWVRYKKPVYWIITTEYTKAKVPYQTKRPFRKYGSWEDSLRDWAGLLTRGYPKAVEAAKQKDFVKFAKELQAGGYATDPYYASQLVRLNTQLEAQV